MHERIRKGCVVVGMDWVDIWDRFVNFGRGADMKWEDQNKKHDPYAFDNALKGQLDTVQMVLNGHRLFTKKDFEYGGYQKGSIVDLIMKGHCICRDCYEADINLMNTICPNKGVGELQVLKPVFMFHLTDGKQMAVIGEKITMEREHFVVWEEGKIVHIFRKDLVKYVVKQ